MEDLPKIDLNAPPKNNTIQESASRRTMTRLDRQKKFAFPLKTLIIFLVVLAILVVGATFMVVLPAKKTYTSAMITYKQAKVAWAAVKKQNVAQASDELAKTKDDLTDTQKNLHQLSFLHYVPLASGYYNDADHLVNAGFDGLDAAKTLIEAIKPYADVLGLKGAGSFVMGSAEQRIQTAVLTMGKITPRIDDIATSLVRAQKEIDMVDPNHYPSSFGGDKIKTQLKTLRSYTDEGVVFVSQARPLIKVLPSLLGESQEKKYLVLFQNDKELRPTGGFITAYAIFRVEKGLIHVDQSSDIYDLDNTLRKTEKVPDPIVKYLPKVTTFNLRDSNLSPDFVDSMKTFGAMYKNTGRYAPVDGIIALDTSVLVSTIKILDDKVDASGITFTTVTDKRCNCPQVIYALEDQISRPVNYIKTERKDLLGSLLFAILGKALKSSPKIYWGPLFQNMLTQINQKHVLFYIYNTDAQSGIEALNAAGKIQPFDGDYLHINEANFGGAKSNLYVKEAVDQKIDIASDGTVTKTVTIGYKNPFPPSDCDLEHGALCLNALLRDWIRIYVPKGSTLVKSVGSEVKMTSYDELGKTVFEGFLTVNPLGTATFSVTYRLPFKVGKGSSLPLFIQKQPGTDNNDYTIEVNGKKVDTFMLLTDKTLKLGI